MFVLVICGVVALIIMGFVIKRCFCTCIIPLIIGAVIGVALGITLAPAKGWITSGVGKLVVEKPGLVLDLWTHGKEMMNKLRKDGLLKGSPPKKPEPEPEPEPEKEDELMDMVREFDEGELRDLIVEALSSKKQKREAQGGPRSCPSGVSEKNCRKK